MKNSIPLTEKYRPKLYDNIVLDSINSKIFNNILDKGQFPNILLYGPPGTGKTTTVMNLTKAFLEKHHKYSKELIIHLNASDDRGIDIIRNQINTFANTSCLFQKGIKFVILDEVDHMTKIAQQSLQSIINNYSDGIRFCLMCNYISKIDFNLKNELMLLRFNNLPREKINLVLKSICKQENIVFEQHILDKLQDRFKSDIRSMLNYIQNTELKNIEFVQKEHLNHITTLLQNESVPISCIENYVYELTTITHESVMYIIHLYILNMLRNVENNISDIFEISKKIIHYNYVGVNYSVSYFFHKMRCVLIR